jgi:hypothetical protein
MGRRDQIGIRVAKVCCTGREEDEVDHTDLVGRKALTQTRRDGEFCRIQHAYVENIYYWYVICGSRILTFRRE